MRFVALLRGINVGGKNKLPMVELATLFQKAGASDVSWFIQSGNVAYHADDASGVARRVERLIVDRFGFEAPIVVRSAADMARVLRDNPFLAAGEDPEKLHVGFLAKAPSAAAIASLDQGRSLPDRFIVKGAEVYLHLPNGVARTKLTNAYFDSRLGTVTTIRNYNTVLMLAAMSAGS